ncbi:hypothetical protein DL768_006391 [Monosporascus sp. mg162]|nr:hypothetical protein DL768_006391 [Monosporascus sp. mg162]
MHQYEVVTTSFPSGPVKLETGALYLALHSNDANDSNSGFYGGIVYVADEGLATYILLALGPKEMRTRPSSIPTNASTADSGRRRPPRSCWSRSSWRATSGKQAIGAQALAIRNICEEAPNPQNGMTFAHRVKRGEQCTCRPWALEVVDTDR